MALDDLLMRVKHRKEVVMLLPIVAGVFLGGLMVVKPSLTRLSVLKAEKTGLSQKETLYKGLVEEEKKLIAYRRSLSKIDDKAKLIEELNTLAAQSGLTVVSMVPDEKKTVTATYLERVGVRIEAEGNYHQLGDFVSRVENLEQFSKILGLDINTEAERGDDFAGGAELAAARIRSSKDNSYKISLVVGLIYPAEGVF